MFKANIVNIVVTSDLKQAVDLIKIGDLEFGIHDEMFYGGRVAYLKSPEMAGKVTIFPSGKMISVGTKSKEEALSDLQCAMQMLVEAGLVKPVSINARIRNAVATVNFGKSIDLSNCWEVR